jgi:hypothetical protein
MRTPKKTRPVPTTIGAVTVSDRKDTDSTAVTTGTMNRAIPARVASSSHRALFHKAYAMQVEPRLRARRADQPETDVGRLSLEVIGWQEKEDGAQGC